MKAPPRHKDEKPAEYRAGHGVQAKPVKQMMLRIEVIVGGVRRPVQARGLRNLAPDFALWQKVERYVQKDAGGDAKDQGVNLAAARRRKEAHGNCSGRNSRGRHQEDRRGAPCSAQAAGSGVAGRGLVRHNRESQGKVEGRHGGVYGANYQSRREGMRGELKRGRVGRKGKVRKLVLRRVQHKPEEHSGSNAKPSDCGTVADSARNQKGSGARDHGPACQPIPPGQPPRLRRRSIRSAVPGARSCPHPCRHRPERNAADGQQLPQPHPNGQRRSPSHGPHTHPAGSREGD